MPWPSVESRRLKKLSRSLNSGRPKARSEPRVEFPMSCFLRNSTPACLSFFLTRQAMRSERLLKVL